MAERMIIRRRPSPEQGRALEKLGHAVEYLVDSRLAMVNEPLSQADIEATDILMRLSRSVFAECKEIVPLWRRVWMRLMRTRQEPDLRQEMD